MPLSAPMRRQIGGVPYALVISAPPPLRVEVYGLDLWCSSALPQPEQHLAVARGNLLHIPGQRIGGDLRTDGAIAVPPEGKEHILESGAAQGRGGFQAEVRGPDEAGRG